MRFGSVCSGIEAASVAWGPLGWQAAFFSEVDKFPSAVLAHHYPNVPNLGDMTKWKEWPDADIDVLVGGTPCQSFSVAGLRKGLDDPRGNLALVFLGIVDRYRPRWVVWENVPGVLSSISHTAPDQCPPPDPVDLGCDGQEVEIDDEYDAEEVHGFACFLAGLSELGYGCKYRTLDAQYIRVDGYPGAVPQRRRRVFVVGYLGDWRRAAAVLFEPESLRGDPAPRREAGKGFAADVVSSLTASGRGVERAGETRGQDPVVAVPEVGHCLNAHGGGSRRIDAESETFVACFDPNQVTSKTNRSRPTPELCHTLPATPNAPIAFSCKDYGNDAAEGVSPTMRSMNFDASHANAGGQLAVAFDMRGREGGAQFEGPHETANIRAASGGSSKSYIAETMAVRRLTPRECERLQGFPDDYTLIEYRGKPAADGPRYKALGNSMAVNVMRWIGMRIALAEAVIEECA